MDILNSKGAVGGGGGAEEEEGWPWQLGGSTAWDSPGVIRVQEGTFVRLPVV